MKAVTAGLPVYQNSLSSSWPSPAVKTFSKCSVGKKRFITKDFCQILSSAALLLSHLSQILSASLLLKVFLWIPADLVPVHEPSFHPCISSLPCPCPLINLKSLCHVPRPLFPSCIPPAPTLGPSDPSQLQPRVPQVMPVKF